LPSTTVCEVGVPPRFCRISVSPGRNPAIWAPTMRALTSVTVPFELPLAVT
jgi:hypothetical protein